MDNLPRCLDTLPRCLDTLPRCLDTLPRCLLCKISFPNGELYIDHMKQHLTEYNRSRNSQNLDTDHDLFVPCKDHQDMVKVVRGSRKRLTKRRKRKEDVRIGDWKDTHHESYSDDCLGDSELSDSDTEEERIDRMERDRREMRILLAKTRLSLAKNNLTVVIQMILFVCYA